MSTVAMSWLHGTTASMMVLGIEMYFSMRPFTCITTDVSWPLVAVRTMPGRSMMVRSGDSEDDNLITMESVEKLLAVPPVRYSVSFSIRSHKSSTDDTMPVLGGSE